MKVDFPGITFFFFFFKPQVFDKESKSVWLLYKFCSFKFLFHNKGKL